MSDPRDQIKIFVGVDPRQPVALSVLQDSIVWRSSRPVAITPLVLNQLPIKRRGLTDFTFSRFLVPWLCDFKGSAIFMDADVLVTGDIADLIDVADYGYDVQVMSDQPQFEWPSVMLFNNARCRILTPDYIEDTENKLYDWSWTKAVGVLPKEWNACVGYGDTREAKLYHFTQGIPCWPETKGNHPQDDFWLKQFRHANSSVPWKDLMADSVHAKKTMEKYQERKGAENRIEIVTNAHKP